MTDDHIEPDAIERMIVRHEAESRILAQYFDMDYDVSIRLHDATAAMLRALRSENAALKAERDALRQLRIDHEVIYGASEASAEAEVVRLRERVAALEAEQDASCNAEELRQTRVDRDALRAEQDALQQVLVDVTAHLVAAHSLLKRGGKKAAGSDKMFTIMLKDYEASIERGRNVVRAALKEGK